MSQLTDLANTPLEKQIIPPELQPAMGQIVTDTNQLPALYEQGLATEGGFLTPPAAARAGAALGGPDQTANVLGALGLRNQRMSDDYVNNMKQGIELNAPVTKQAGFNQQLGNINQLGQINLNNYKIMKQQQMNQTRVQIFEQQQQQSLIAGILGIIGSIGGAVIGGLTGGPVGAAAGAAAGSKL